MHFPSGAQQPLPRLFRDGNLDRRVCAVEELQAGLQQGHLCRVDRLNSHLRTAVAAGSHPANAFCTVSNTFDRGHLAIRNQAVQDTNRSAALSL